MATKRRTENVGQVEREITDITNEYLESNYIPYYQMIGDHRIDWKILNHYIPDILGVFSISFYKRKKDPTQEVEVGQGFEVYKNGLERRIEELIQFMKRDLGFWKIRIYCEESVRNELVNILNMRFLQDNLSDSPKYRGLKNIHLIELYEYSFGPLLDETRKHHFETFGTIMRALPFIRRTDGPELIKMTERGFNQTHYFGRVLMIDIDRSLSFIRKQILLKFCHDTSIQLGYDARETYDLIDHIECFEKVNGGRPLHFWPIINHFYYQFNIFYPYELFVDFFNRSMGLWLINNNSGRRKYKNQCLMNVFGYGYDEYFTNNYILRYYLEQRVRIEIYLSGGYYGILHALIRFVGDKDLFDDNELRQIFTDIILSFSFQDKIKPDFTLDDLRELGIEFLKNANGQFIGNERFRKPNGTSAKYKTSLIDLRVLHHKLRELKPTNDIHKKLYKYFHERFYKNIRNDEDITGQYAFPHTQMITNYRRLIGYLESIGHPVPRNIINSLIMNEKLNPVGKYTKQNVNKHSEIYYFIDSIGRTDIKLKRFVVDRPYRRPPTLRKLINKPNENLTSSYQ